MASLKPILKEESLLHQAMPELYTLLAHSKYESSSIPMDPNLLKFKNNLLETQFFNSLISNHQDMNKSSSEFTFSLISFGIFYTVFTAVKLISTIILYLNHQASYSSLVFQCFFIGSLSVSLAAIFRLTYKRQSFRKRSRILFGIFSMFLSAYLIIGDERIYSEISAYEYHSNHIDHLLPMLAFIIKFKQLFFNSFKHFLTLVLWTMSLYLALFMYSSQVDKTVISAEFFIIAFFLTLEVFDVNQCEYRMKQIFYRKLKENQFDSNLKEAESISTPGDDIQCGLEVVVKMCEDLQNTLRSASHISMCPELRNTLTTAFSGIESIKRRIVKSDIFKEVVIDRHGQLDEEDKEFICQNYLVIPSASASITSSIKHNTFVDNLNTQHISSFQDYGIQQLQNALSGVGLNWNFDIWLIYSASGHSVFIMGKYLMKKWSLDESLDIPETVSDSLFIKIEEGYNKNPYHNACHAADVLHSMLFFILNSFLIHSINDIDIVSCIIAALSHDIQHPGVTNRFLVNTRDSLAMEYNDNSVLENMHAAKIFSILSCIESDIFINLPTDIYFRDRKLIIDMILGTDMTKHFNLLSFFRTRAINLADVSIDKEEDRSTVLSMALKCADLGHTAKPLDLHRKWTEMVCEEFFCQGDMEKQRNLPVSMYCDRENTDVSKSQAGFLKNVCMPLYESWVTYLNSEGVRNLCSGNLKKNFRYWEAKSRARRATVHLVLDAEEATRESSLSINKRKNRVCSLQFGEKSDIKEDE